MRARPTPLWILPLLALTGCDRTETSAVTPRQVPIVAPDLADAGPARCEGGELQEHWSYTWRPDGAPVAFERARGDAVAHDDLTVDAAGRLTGWRRTGDGAVTLRFDRDAEGRLTGWQRAAGGELLTVAVLADHPDEVRLRLQGTLALTLIELDADAPLRPEADPLIQRALPHQLRIAELLVARHGGDGGALTDALADADVVETQRFDAAGRLTEIAWDLDQDGIADGTEQHTHTGGAVEIALDVDGDGVADEITERRFDAQGRRTYEAVQGQRVTTWDDSEIGLLRVFEDGDLDGTAEHVTWIYQRPDGQRVLKYEDYDGDGAAEWRRRYWYSAAGARTFAERDGDVDGVIDQRVEHRDDADGRRVETRILRPDPEGCGGRW